MSDEIAAYADLIRRRFRLIADAVQDMTQGELNAAPAPGANSPWVLATHTIGNAYAWILGIAAGDDRRRDRPAEFASRGESATELVAALEAASRNVANSLAALDPARLDLRLTPPQELWGEGPPREITVRDAIVQVIEHAALHHGHLQVTKDVLRNR